MADSTHDISVDPYKILGHLGSGGMADVYLAEDTRDGRRVALKTLPRAYRSSGRLIARFEREISSLRQLDHPNIIKILDEGQSDGLPYYVMEYISGPTLKDMLRENGLFSADRVVEIATAICSALAYAHGLGIVHRDIKPANIIMGTGGEIKVADFGIAQAIDRTRLTGAKGVGTPQYMSPEQIRGERVDGRSDLYSLGILMFELLTGRVPFSGKTPVEIAVKQMEETAPDPRSINSTIPEWLSEVILHLMEKDPDARFSNARETMRILAAAEAITTRREAARKRRRAVLVIMGKRKAALICVILLMAIGLAASLVGYSISHRSAPASLRKAEISKTVQTVASASEREIDESNQTAETAAGLVPEIEEVSDVMPAGDKIFFKTGAVKVGIIEEETNTMVRFRVRNAIFGVGRDTIEKIEYAGAEEKEQLRMRWNEEEEQPVEESEPQSGGVERIAWWRFDGNCSDALNRHDGIGAGGFSFVPGVVEQALHLDGSSGYVSVPDSPELSALDDFTIEAWIRLERLDNAGIVTKLGPGPASDDEFHFVTLDGYMHFNVFGNRENHGADTGVELDVGTWHHVYAYFSKSAQKIGIYIDDHWAALLDHYQAPRDSDEPLKIGLNTWGWGDPLRYFKGDIDEVIIWRGNPLEIAVSPAPREDAPRTPGMVKVGDTWVTREEAARLREDALEQAVRVRQR